VIRYDAGKRPPALVLCAQIAGLALARQFGRAGIAVGMVDFEADATGFQSRYCRVATCVPKELGDDAIVARIESAADRLGGKPVLLPTSDEFLLLVSRNRQRLSERFRFLLPEADLLEALIDKRRMRALAVAHGIPAPRDITVTSELDLPFAAREIGFPCLLKSAYSKPGGRCADLGKIRVKNLEQMRTAYAILSTLDPRIIVQEYLAGSCEMIALYNAYFDACSRPVAVFTGRKLRQFPVDFGTASLSECCPIPEVALMMTQFFQTVGYRGPVDMGLKFDPRDGRYKVFDINPRLGQNYRTYVADDGSDLGWLAYQELSGESPYRPGPWRTATKVRRWFIEDNDWRSSRELRSRGQLTWWGWLRSLAKVREGAYCSWRDPRPLFARIGQIRSNRAAAARPQPAVEPAPLLAAEPQKVQATAP
jgi:predicted ATP-grasp superfamily ATP-dependent carboligase